MSGLKFLSWLRIMYQTWYQISASKKHYKRTNSNYLSGPQYLHLKTNMVNWIISKASSVTQQENPLLAVWSRKDFSQYTGRGTAQIREGWLWLGYEIHNLSSFFLKSCTLEIICNTSIFSIVLGISVFSNSKKATLHLN